LIKLKIKTSTVQNSFFLIIKAVKEKFPQSQKYKPMDRQQGTRTILIVIVYYTTMFGNQTPIA